MKQEAIELSSVSTFLIENSRASNAWTGMYLTNCKDGKIRGNSISSTAGDGMLLQSTNIGNCRNIVIDSNSIKDWVDTGIDLDITSGIPHENIVVSGNIVEHTTPLKLATGIRASQSRDIVITNNVITKADTGINVDSPPVEPRSVIISGNTIDGFIGSGIKALYDGAVVSGNSINGAATSPSTRIGIGLAGDNVQVTNNFISRIDYGIRYIGSSTTGVIDGNVIKDPNKYGIADDPTRNFNISSFNIANNVIRDWRATPLMVRGIDFGGTNTDLMTIQSNKIIGFVTKPAINIPDKTNQLSLNQINGQIPSGAFSIYSGFSDGAPIKITNPQVTKSSIILFSFEGDANTVAKLSVSSMTAGSDFTVKVYTTAKTTAVVTVNYVIFN